jgi:hypothetical protein
MQLYPGWHKITQVQLKKPRSRLLIEHQIKKHSIYRSIELLTIKCFQVQNL